MVSRAPAMTDSSKDAIRATVRAALADARAESVGTRSQAICARLLAYDIANRASVVLAHAPSPPEADIRFAVRAWITGGKTVCLPRIDWDARTMAPAVVTDLDNLVTKRHGILEPPDDAPTVGVEDLDLILVPGVAFDEKCNRLGRGGGFYDRFLATVPARVKTVGVAFEAQVIPCVPMDRHDRALDAVVTESRVILRPKG